jgi:thiol-disulfide isomerase/thioredoxin
MIVGLMLAGCTGANKRPGPAGKDTPRPDDTVPPAPVEVPQGQPTATSKTGLLAGQVIYKFSRRPARADILVEVSTEGGTPPAPLRVETNPQGYFVIPRLEPGQTYRLTAQARDGDRVLAGTTISRPPDPRMVIEISEDFVSPATPKPAPPPAVVPTPPREEEKKQPEAKSPPAEKPQPEEKPESKPAASLERPTAPKDSAPASSIPEIKIPRPDLRINVPPRTPRLSIPSVPSEDTARAVKPSPYAAQPLPVPSCVMLTRRQVDNFALNGLDGKPWEFKRDRKGRLVLLDFWHTRCPPCLAAIAHLNKFHDSYKDSGLEVIGVACESYAPNDRFAQVAAVRNRFDIHYRVLMWGNEGPLKPCPLYTSLGVPAYPTLKLLDEKGNIVWESVGLGPRQEYELKMEIERRLKIRPK